MATFQIQAPDGGIYEVEGDNEEGAIQFLQSQLGQQQPQQQPSPENSGWGDTAIDAAKSFGSGVLRGATDLVGLPGSISDFINNNLSRGLGLPDLPQSSMSGTSLNSGLSSVSGGANQYDPKTTTGEYAGTIGEFVPGAAAFGGLSPSNIAKYGIAPAITSEAAGQATDGTNLEPYARVAGALAGPAIVSGAQKAITPFGVSAERQAATDFLRSRGVEPTAGQVTGSKGLQAREAELGGGAVTEKASEQFTKAALESAGIRANRATPEVLEKGYESLGRQFDDLSSKSSTPFTTQHQDDLLNIVSGYAEDAAQVAPVVENMVNRVGEMVAKGKGVLKGKDYQELRSSIGKKAQSASDYQTKSALREIQEVLDDAVEQSLSASNKEAWKSVRGEYRNYLTIERAATAAGEGAANGLISPAQLRSAAVNMQGRRNYAFGKGDLQELSRAGTQIMTPLPNSGTALRLDARTLGGVGGGAGGAIGYGVGGPVGSVAGALAGAAAPVVAGRTIMSRPVQAYLGNNLMGGAAKIDPIMYNPLVASALASSYQQGNLSNQ